MQWTESVGLTLVNRDLASMQLRTPNGQILTYSVLQTFPFTSESKRMGIIVRVPACPPGLPSGSPSHWLLGLCPQSSVTHFRLVTPGLPKVSVENLTVRAGVALLRRLRQN